VPLQSVAPLEVENLYKEQLATRGRNGRLLNPKTARGTHVVLRKALADAERLGLVVRRGTAEVDPAPSCFWQTSGSERRPLEGCHVDGAGVGYWRW